MLPSLLWGFELATFRSRVWHSNQQAILALVCQRKSHLIQIQLQCDEASLSIGPLVHTIEMGFEVLTWIVAQKPQSARI